LRKIGMTQRDIGLIGLRKADQRRQVAPNQGLCR
jgi:hypothetical protein